MPVVLFAQIMHTVLKINLYFHMKKILIIEDDQDIVDLTILLLESEGYEVHSFTNFFGV